MSTHYEKLGVEQDASPEELKKAYRKKAMECHPDQHKNDPEKTEQFQALVKAYDTLSDEDDRAYYDRTGEDKDETNPEHLARGMLVDCFQHLIDKEGDRIFWVDLIGSIKKAFDADTEECKHVSNKANREITRLEKISKKLKYKGDENIVHVMLNQMIAREHATIEQAAMKIKVMGLARTLLQDYEFKKDSGVPPSSGFSNRMLLGSIYYGVPND